MDTSADKDNIRDTISDSEPNSAVDKLGKLYISYHCVTVRLIITKHIFKMNFT